MVLMRVLIVSWFVLQCLVAPIGARTLPAPTSDFTASDIAEQEEYSAYDEALVGVVRIRKDKMARRTVASRHNLCSASMLLASVSLLQ